MSSERDANDDEKLSAELEPVAKAIAEDCSVWPEPFREELEVEWPDLETDDGSIEKWVFDHQKVLIRVVTWNQNAKTPPPIADFIKTLLPRNKYVYL